MTGNLGVAELKRRFSEILNRVELYGERVVVRRHGRAVAVLGPASEADEIEPQQQGPRRGLAAAAGAWEEYPDIDNFLAEIRAARDRSVDRQVEPFE